MSKIAELLKAYTFNQNKPVFTSNGLNIFDAESKENGLKFTIKLLRRADADVASYLQKLKSAASEYVIKIYELLNEPESNQLLVVHEAVPYGTVASALSKPKRFQDDDALAISKQLLQGHIDLLRNGVYWTGTEADLDITQNGIKLSWNNSMVYSQNNPNPFPELITRIAVRREQEGLLPFPNNKMIQDLIKVSKENASEMSLHPLLKKRQKVFKKKGKNWLGLKQFKIKGQYGQDLTYTAVNRQYGLVRVRVFQKGQVDQNLIKVYQTKPSFTKLLAYYEQGENWITISEYSNDGNVQSYVKRLKASNIQLKQNHIQFIFFSLIDPLKFINASHITSFNLLHIKSVYLENGIPKIGQVQPMNQGLRDILTQRSDVPDFYHKDFKMQPATKDAKYDTYSLGVLLYKLMYTQYPIFPEGQVHIPTTPTYKKALKEALMLFLNKGGILTDLQNELQVSDDIKNQVKQNEKILYNGTGQMPLLQEQGNAVGDHIQQLSIGLQEERVERQKKKSCLGKVWDWINTRGKDVNGRYRRMQLSSFAFYRECTVAISIVLLYFLVFFLPYMVGFFKLMSTTQLFFSAYFNVLGQNHRTIITNYNTFQTAFASLGALNDTTPITNTLGCILDDTGSYYSFFKPTSAHWYSYLIVSFITFAIILIIKGFQSGKFSLIRVAHHYYDETIDGANESRFVLSSYVYFQLWFFMCLYCFFYLYNFIYNSQTSPCLGGLNWSSLTQQLATDRVQFLIQYCVIIFFTFLMGIISFLHIIKFYAAIPYNSLLNPIFVYTPIYFALFILMRIGTLTTFAPSFTNNTNGVIGSSFVNFIGYFPQLLWGAEIVLELLIDVIFYNCADEKIERFVLTQTAEDIKT